ncbi:MULTISPECIES: glycosyltransferase family 4 protein [Marinobacter]|jgi:glycosyltransferase involved in cell wall biosynthesis|uniref:Glycosyl transferase n=3 Tax=Marinobacter TaxID=2742 RepID=A0A455WC21_MARNT|nr:MULTISPECIES: glycosyltransferase family 4 protein [Marinobacter]KXO11766.1 glycosyl transferase group 1 [Marinobacter excellens LAMA 842]MAO14196.1 glycosyltransferase WbuB [Marinobacter sp.]BBJ03853.1 glycosyl transferase [Marinobacter nauticus]
MDIFVLYKEDYPWDVRIEKIAKSLRDRGHNVTIVARNLSGNSPVAESDGLPIIRLPVIGAANSLVRKLANVPIWFNPFWIRTLNAAISGSENPVIIVRDLPLVKTALSVAKSRNVKVVLDMAEVYPYMYASARMFSKGLNLETLAKSPSMAARYESKVLPKVDHTLVMIEESQDRVLNKGIDPGKVTIVSNTPPATKFSGTAHQHQGRNLRLVYVGFLTKLRGLDLLIKAASAYVKMGNEPSSLKIDIVGKGSERENLINLVKELNLEQSVTVHGWLEHEQVDQLMAQANVGALTYRVCPHWNHTIPNKIFDYMLAGLPVLATEVKPIERIINETKSGLVCRDNDVRDIAEKLQILRSPETRATLGANGVSAVQSKYNWANDERRLHAVIDSLENQVKFR